MLMIENTLNSLNKSKFFEFNHSFGDLERRIFDNNRCIFESAHYGKREARDRTLRNIKLTEETRKVVQMYFVLIIE